MLTENDFNLYLQKVIIKEHREYLQKFNFLFKIFGQLFPNFGNNYSKYYLVNYNTLYDNQFGFKKRYV